MQQPESNPALSGLRERAGAWVESTRVSTFIMVLIVINAITLGMQTSATLNAEYGVWSAIPAPQQKYP